MAMPTQHCCVLPTNVHRLASMNVGRAGLRFSGGGGVWHRVKLGRTVVASVVGGAHQVRESARREQQEGEGHVVQTVVIVGAGLAGLATALALHRVGVKALVLEQAGSLRLGGTSLGLFPNAWRALDALGIADELRGSLVFITGARMRYPDGKVITEFQNSDLPGGPHELRAVERQRLLRHLAESLPSGTIQFNSRVKNIRNKKSLTEVELEDSTVIRTKVLVGCDGARSVVASWLGRREPQPVGQTAIRGLSDFKSDHGIEPNLEQIIGQGVHAGWMPVTNNKAYWFVVFNTTPSVPARISDPDKIKEEALTYTQGWPSDIQACIRNTPREGVSRHNLRDRWSLPSLTPHHGVTLAGDAAHPMMPGLAQGGCTSLEDAVVLTRKLCEALRTGDGSSESVGAALREYERERWGRTLGVTMKSSALGLLMSWDADLVCWLRDRVVLPVTYNAPAVFSSTHFDCGVLPPPLD